MAANMPRLILYFTEYVYYLESGAQVSPYMENGEWFMPGINAPVSLTDIGKLYNIDEQELNYLKLKYGG